MSTRYPGGVITKTPIVPAGPYEDGAAPGIWTLDQQLQAQKSGIWPTAGLQPGFIEDMFSTYLVKPTTSNTTYSVTNGIDVSGEGGMVWMKARDAGSTNNLLYDTVRGASSIANNALISNSTSAQQTANFDYITGLSNGFTVNFASGGGQLTNNGINYASWTFRKQPKFFDVVTWTGNGSAPRIITHNLGSIPGCVIGKRTSATSDWTVYHRSLNGGTNPDQYQVLLNTTAAQSGPGAFLLAAPPTSTGISLASGFNSIGVTYVAYLFAHDAGGFGLTGTDNVISCGSFTSDASGFFTATLGYEPQWVMFKQTNATGDWRIIDTMRGMTNPYTNGARLLANTSAAEGTGNGFIEPTATGFYGPGTGAASGTYIYIAIRRGPMKVPTVGTKVFAPQTRTGTGAAASVTGVGFTPDLLWSKSRNTGGAIGLHDRLRGPAQELLSNSTAVEYNDPSSVVSINMDGYSFGTDASGSGTVNVSGSNFIYWNFRRAPGFFDEVCYTGTGSARTVAHNLGVAPELMIVKTRSAASSWFVFSGFTVSNSHRAYLEDTSAGGIVAYGSANFLTSSPTATSLPLGSAVGVNASSATFVAYLFATVAGVSKVGSYTGTGTTLQINCGFTAGARFVLIKRTDSTGDWYVWDSARGIVAGNDPYLLLNSSAAEVTSTDYVDTFASGFEISSTAPAAINASGGSFLFLAIA